MSPHADRLSLTDEIETALARIRAVSRQGIGGADTAEPADLREVFALLAEQAEHAAESFRELTAVQTQPHPTA